MSKQCSRPLNSEVGKALFGFDIAWIELHIMDDRRQVITLCGVHEDGRSSDVPGANFIIHRVRAQITPRDPEGFDTLANAFLSQLEHAYAISTEEPPHAKP